MQFVIASDHAGFELKKIICDYLISENKLVVDLGPQSADSVDYPDYAKLLAQQYQVLKKATQDQDTFGILICGSGQGMCISANRFAHIRAALVYSDEVARLARLHNDANVICLGSRLVSSDDALKYIKIFSDTKFEGGRHQKRVDLLSGFTER